MNSRQKISGISVLFISAALIGCAGKGIPSTGSGDVIFSGDIQFQCEYIPKNLADAGNWLDMRKIGCQDKLVLQSKSKTSVEYFKTPLDKMMTSKSDISILTNNGNYYVEVAGGGSRIPTSDSKKYKGYDLSDIRFEKLRPLVYEILEAYGSPETEIGKIRAMRDWVARTAIHPYPPLHGNVNKNTAVLPQGMNWVDVTRSVYSENKWAEDSSYWGQYELNGYDMLNKLINFDSTESAPLMEKVGPSHYRMKKLSSDNSDPENYRFVFCTHQAYILMALASSLGIQGMLVSATGHDFPVFYMRDLGKWVIQDPTYNEEFVNRVTGELASPEDLYYSSSVGEFNTQYAPIKIGGPQWDTDIYINPDDDSRATYGGDAHPDGMTAVGSNLIQSYDKPFRTNLWQYDAPIFYNRPDDVSTVGLSLRNRTPVMSEMFPKLGISVGRVVWLDSKTAQIHLESNVPYHDKFQIQLPNGEWGMLQDVLELSYGQNALRVRAIDKSGYPSGVATISIGLN